MTKMMRNWAMRVNLWRTLKREMWASAVFQNPRKRRYWHADSLKLRLLWYIRRTFFESSQIM